MLNEETLLRTHTQTLTHAGVNVTAHTYTHNQSITNNGKNSLASHLISNICILSVMEIILKRVGDYI